MINLIEDVTKDYEKHYNSIPYETFIEILKLDPQTKFVNNEPDKIGPNASGLLLQRYMKGDIEFLNYDTNEKQHILNNGEFIVLFPQDAHQPSISYNEKATVKKVVVKVLI